MTPQELAQLGAAGVLAVVVIAFYTDRVVTRKSADDRVAVVAAMWQDRHADTAADRDAWKAQAQQLAPAVGKMADELEEANERDEQWKQAFTRNAEQPDRRQ